MAKMGRKALQDVRGRGREAFPDGREGFGRPSWRDGSHWESLLESQRGGSPFQKAGWEALPDGRNGSEGSPGWPEEVGRPSWMAGRGRKALPGPGMGWKALLNSWEGLGGPPRGLEAVGSLSQRARGWGGPPSRWKSIPEGEEDSGGHPSGPAGVGSPS